MKLNNYFKSSAYVSRSSILRQAMLLCIVSCFFSLSAWATNCYDITAGSIGGSQTICTGGDPATFTNTASATTGQGTGVKYIWLRYVGASAPSNSSSATVISGATASTYNPPAGSVTAKTWFRRCAAPNSAWCSTYNGESNWVSVGVTAPATLVCEAKVNGTWSTLISCSVSVCTTNSLWLSVNPNVSTVTWTGPNGFTASGNDALISNSITTTNAGTYTAALTQNGCTSTTTIQVIVNSCGVNCSDITAGSIGTNQTVCTGGDPAVINSLSAATTGQGTGVKYIWLRYVGASAPSNSSSATVVSGAIAATYDPPAGSVTATTWFRRCAAPNSVTCTTYSGESNWVSVSVTACGGTCSTISNLYQVTNTHDNCGTNCSDYMMLLPNNGGCFLANNVYLTEYNNGSATLQGTATNSSGAVATINVTLSGKTCTGTPYYGLCISSGGGAWCYYSTMTGTINVTGIGNLNIVSYMHPFQIGMGANLQQNVFGASGWFTVNGSSANAGDFNINLTSVAALAATASSTCSGTTSNISLNVSGGRPSYTYVWSNAATTQNLSNLANGTYTVTITDANGCTTTASAAANCSTNCSDITAGSIGSNQTICTGGDPAAFTSITAATTSQSVGVKYVWLRYVGASVPSNSSSATVISGATAATYDPPAGSVTAKTWFRRCAAPNSASCTTYNGESNWVSVDVITTSSGITSVSTTCALENVLFQVVNPDATCTYSWNFGPNGTPLTATGTSATAQFSVAAVGTAQTVTLTVSKNGCSATFTKSITVTPEVFANAGPDKEICQGGSTQIGGSPAGPAGGTFTWTPNAFLNSNTVANPIASPPYTTTYTLTTTLNGCIRTDQVVVSVNVALNPNANAGGAKTVCNGQSIQIGGNPTSTTAGVNYVWSPSNSLSGAYVANPTAYPTTNTTYTVTVTNSTTGCSATSSAPVTVTTCVIPALTINDVTVNENAGTATLQICASATSTSPMTVTYTTSNGTALSGSDYTTTTATATIPAGQTCVNVTFPIIDDNINEPTELFNVTLTNPNGATIADPLGTVTILDNDVLPCNVVINISQKICNNNNTPTNPNDDTYTFVLTVTGTGTGANWAGGYSHPALGVYAFGPTPYNTPITLGPFPASTFSGGNSFPPIVYQNGANIDVSVYDAQNTSCSANTTVMSTGPCSTALPTLSINDVTVNENAGTATLQICTSATSTSPITVTYTTSNGTAMAGSDYGAATASATIPAGQTCANVTFSIIDDNINEPTELFNVTLTNPNGATIADPLGTVTILDNDNPIQNVPDLTISDIIVNENVGTATLQICASATSTLPITVTYTTSNGTAMAGSDYGAATASATIPAGQTCANVTFSIIDDNILEPTELFNVTLTNPNGATIADPLGTVTILDNEPTCDNITNAGTIAANQSGASPFDPAPLTQTVAPIGGSGALEYKWQQSTDNATWTDIVGATGISYDPGSLTTTTYFRRCTRRANCTAWLNTNVVIVTVTIGNTVITIGDKVFFDENNNGIQDGGNEVGLPGISVNLYNSTGGWLAFASTNANGLYSFTSTSVASLVPGSYRVCFNKPWNFNNVSPKDQGANDAIDSDANAISGGSACTDLFTVAAGETKNTVDVGFNNGTTPTLPTLTINDVTVNENAGTATLQICASATSTSPITVTYTTSNGTATSGSDYTATTATATIPAGQTCVNVSVPIIDDNINEPTELFNVNLTNPNGATIADPLGIVTILDNDSPLDCNDIIGGLVGSNQTICTGGDPAAFTNITLATTSQGGTVKYQWFYYVGANQPADMSSAILIAGATGATYDPPAGSVTAKTWFRRCAAPTPCNYYHGESNWISVDVTTCGTPSCANITNIYKVLNTVDNCGSSCTNAPYMMILFNQGGCYTANSVYLTEYNNGTAKLQGTATNNTGLTAVIDVTLSGKTCSGNPYYGLCTNSGGASWCYYTTMNGTITVAGFAPLTLSTFMHPFQMGNGADLQSVAFGASGWFSSNGVDNQGDFNFELTPVASLSVSTTNVCNGSTGTVTATATGGRPPYLYAWSNGATTSAINNLANGTYTVTVTDANGCTATTSAVVNCTTNVCDNVTSGGSLGFYQSGVAPFDPSALVETAAPTGGSGTLEYMWQSSTDNWSWIAIIGVTTASYDPTAITTSTFYRRGVRRASCSNYLYSNSVYKQIVGSPKTDLSENAKTISNLTVAPVPAIDYINVSFDINTEQMVSVSVLDITGRLASAQNIITTEGTNMVSFDVTQMLPGYYIVELNNGITKQHAKFIVMR